MVDPKKHAASQRRYRLRHPDRVSASDKAWKKRNPRRVKGYDRKYRYGLSPEQYINLLSKQGGVCPGCGSTQPNCVDHDHRCCPGKRSCGKCVRGVLCLSCNNALGNVRDSRETLLALVSYLGGYDR